MKKILSLLAAAALLLSLAGCGAPPEDGGKMNKDRPCVVTTLFPAYDFARELAGGRCEVILLVPPGAEAHSYEPTPQDIVRIENCDLLVCNGGESEAWLDELLEGSSGGFRLVRMLDCVEALEEEHKDGMQTVHGEEEEDGPEYDEHVWTSPVNAKKICLAICAELCAIDPEGAEEYSSRCAAYCAELDELDAAFRETVAAGRFKCLVFADRFPVRYFVEEYGLDYYAAFPGCADDTEPSARTVAFLIDRVRETGIGAVMYIEYSDERMADVICEDTGCRKLLFHSCHTVSADDLANGATYLSLMWANNDSLREALG